MPLTEHGRGTAVALAVDLVNSWDELVEPPELLRDVDWLRHWLGWHGFAAAAASLRAEDVAAARELRSRLAEAFDAGSEDEAVAALNDLLAAHGRPPRLERANGRWRLRQWPDASEGLAFAAAYCALGLLEAIRDLGWDRFGRCDAAPCGCAYVDRTRNRSRRYCCALCADRVAQSRYRRRRRQGKPSTNSDETL